MEYFVALILGLVQGLTEFLPVSSTGHLALVNLIFGKDVAGGISFSFFLHTATLIAATIYFRRDLLGLLTCWLPKNDHRTKDRHLFMMLIVACLITGPIGLVLEPFLEPMSDSLPILACGFFATTVVLCGSEWLSQTRQSRNRRKGKITDMTWKNAALVGLFQGIAVIPGLSRSGSTISGGLLGGLRKEEATRFAFLVAFPIIILGAAKDGIGLLKGSVVLPSFWVCLIGFIAAGISGYLAISWMISSLKKVSLYWFGLYTVVLGCLLLTLWFIGG